MKNLYFFLLLLSFWSCTSKIKVDTIVHNAVVYTVNASFEKAEAFAVKGNQFIEIGKSEEILAKYEAKEVIDAQGKSVFPGFYDAHCHFYEYGNFLQLVDLVGTASFQEILQRLQTYKQQNPDKKWIRGRGWDQNDWQIKEFPEKTALDTLFPDTPVLLERIDGHAAIANQKALDLAKITAKTTIEGGKIELKNNQPTGILIDNAIELVSKIIPPPTEQEIEKALFDAQEKCFAVGLTSVADAGLSRHILEMIDKMQKVGSLQMRIYAMVSANEENLKYYLEKGKYKTDFLNIRSFKIYADGALGSRGACLLEPYADKPNERGFLLSNAKKLEEIIQKLYEKDFQANTHCIGDSANRLILNIYGKYLKSKNDKRWRIEHAQVVHPADIQKFGQFSVLPSVQPTHATSDMYWAETRLGNPRVKTAYAFKDLYEQNKLIPFGSDFPVEDINPLYGFHAAVARQDAKQFPEKGYQIENAVNRQVALQAMTIWAAFAAFEEKEKGSIEKGKFADFVILEQDIMQIPDNQLRSAQVLQTFINGKRVFPVKK